MPGMLQGYNHICPPPSWNFTFVLLGHCWSFHSIKIRKTILGPASCPTSYGNTDRMCICLNQTKMNLEEAIYIFLCQQPSVLTHWKVGQEWHLLAISYRILELCGSVQLTCSIAVIHFSFLNIRLVRAFLASSCCQCSVRPLIPLCKWSSTILMHPLKRLNSCYCKVYLIAWSSLLFLFWFRFQIWCILEFHLLILSLKDLSAQFWLHQLRTREGENPQ